MQRLLLFIISLGAFAALSQGAELSPTWQAISAPAAPSVFKVLQYLDVGPTSNLVLLGEGRRDGMLAGTVLKTYRMSVHGGDGRTAPRTLWVETGRLRTLEVQDGGTVAAVEGQGSQLSKALFPKFPGVMAGDLAVPQRLNLNRRQALMPNMTLSYQTLFADPKSSPTSFELTADGGERLKAAAQTFAASRLSMLMVEGYTDHHGSANVNQVESYQRALTVRQYLVDELGFDPQRVIAIGYGEAEPADPSMAPGQVEHNRRIVLKAVPVLP